MYILHLVHYCVSDTKHQRYWYLPRACMLSFSSHNEISTFIWENFCLVSCFFRSSLCSEFFFFLLREQQSIGAFKCGTKTRSNLIITLSHGHRKTRWCEKQIFSSLYKMHRKSPLIRIQTSRHWCELRRFAL